MGLLAVGLLRRPWAQTSLQLVPASRFHFRIHPKVRSRASHRRQNESQQAASQASPDEACTKGGRGRPVLMKCAPRAAFPLRSALTSGACCAQGGPAHSDGPSAHTSGSAHVPAAALCSNDFSSCTSLDGQAVPWSGFWSVRSCGSERRGASVGGTCSPWPCGSSALWRPYRGHPGVPASVGSRCGSVSGFVTWIRQMWSRSHFSSSLEKQISRGTWNSSVHDSGCDCGSLGPWASHSLGCRPWLSWHPLLSSWYSSPKVGMSCSLCPLWVIPPA